MKGNNSGYYKTSIPEYLISKEYTVETLVYVLPNTASTSESDRSLILSKGTSGGVYSSWHIAIGSQSTRVDMWGHGTGDISIPMNKWVNITMTIHDGQKYTFIDGELKYRGYTTDYSNSDIYIGYETMYQSYIKDWCYLGLVKLSNISKFQESYEIDSVVNHSLYTSNNNIYGGE